AGQGRGGAAFGVGQTGADAPAVEVIAAVLVEGLVQTLDLVPVTDCGFGEDELVLRLVQRELRSAGFVESADQFPALLWCHRWGELGDRLCKQFAHRGEPGGGGPVGTHGRHLTARVHRWRGPRAGAVAARASPARDRGLPARAGAPSPPGAAPVRPPPGWRGRRG